MSLKAFHIVFIVLSILLACACAVWAFYNQAGRAFGIGAIVAAVALFIYGIWFLKKSRNIIT
jgi:uncharacterized membrane protein SirB2